MGVDGGVNSGSNGGDHQRWEWAMHELGIEACHVLTQPQSETQSVAVAKQCPELPPQVAAATPH